MPKIIIARKILSYLDPRLPVACASGSRGFSFAFSFLCVYHHPPMTWRPRLLLGLGAVGVVSCAPLSKSRTLSACTPGQWEQRSAVYPLPSRSRPAPALVLGQTSECIIGSSPRSTVLSFGSQGAEIVLCRVSGASSWAAFSRRFLLRQNSFSGCKISSPRVHAHAGLWKWATAGAARGVALKNRRVVHISTSPLQPFWERWWTQMRASLGV